jgi:nicotinamidase-related amidase
MFPPRPRAWRHAAAAIFLPVAATACTSLPARAELPAAAQRVTPEDAVLVYVDYVTGLDNLINTIPGPQYRNNVEAFAKLNPMFKIPAVVLGEENDYYGSFFPEITEHVTHDVQRYNRSQISGYVPEFAEWLKSTGRKSVIIGGISIDNCTLHTALDLLRDGYKVYVVVDASGSNTKVAEDMAILRLRDAGAVTTTWLTVMTELGQDFASPYGQAMMASVQGHWPASTIGPVMDMSPDGHGMQLPGVQ